MAEKEEPTVRKLSIFVALLGVLALATSASATVNINWLTGAITDDGSGAGWQAWGAADPNQNGTPYWDNGSADGANKNIGFELVAGPGKIPYLGTAAGTQITDYLFADHDSIAKLKFEIAGNKNFNEFGWYTPGSGVLNTIFAASVSPGDAAATTTVPLSGTFGFYLKTVGGKVYYTESSSQIPDSGTQHLALFMQDPGCYGPPCFWFGVEDLAANQNSDYDYNDMIVKICPIPEPTTMALWGTGLIGMLGGLIRRRRA